jgi:tRNA threonylcarbamoyladenosine biosynthesis protein TsaE
MSEARTTRSPEETAAAAGTFAIRLKRGDVVALYGELGSGKTQFVKGICRMFRVDTAVTSPSFIILNRYQGKDGAGNEILLHHFDLYRIKSIAEMYELGYEEFLKSDGICLVEWAEVLGELLPGERYDVRLALGEAENERLIEISGIGRNDNSGH